MENCQDGVPQGIHLGKSEAEEREVEEDHHIRRAEGVPRQFHRERLPGLHGDISECWWPSPDPHRLAIGAQVQRYTRGEYM